MIEHIIIILLSIVFTTLVSYVMLKVVPSTAFLDTPSERKIHSKTIPRFGGIVFSLCALMIMVWYVRFDAAFSWFIFSALMIVFLGVMDDLYRINFKIKSMVQCIVAIAVFMALMVQIPTIVFFGYAMNIPMIGMFFLFIVWFVGMVNSVNLIDGMDGLAGGAFFIICLGAAYIGFLQKNPTFSMVYLILMGALFGFLMFNGRPAQFFMGDSGSLFLGFCLATMPLVFFLTQSQGTSLDITPFVVLSSYFIMDTLRVMAIRIKNGLHPLKPDTNHMHHQLLAATHSYNRTLLVIFFLNQLCVMLALLQIKWMGGGVAMIIYASILISIVFIARVQTWFLHAVCVVSDGFRYGIKQVRFRRLNLSRWVPFACIAVYMAIYVFSTGLTMRQSWVFIGIIGVLWVGVRYVNHRFVRLYRNGTYLITLILVGSAMPLPLSGGIVLLEMAGLMLMVGISVLFYMRRVMMYLLRFWQIEDLLMAILMLFMYLIHAISVPMPVFFPSVKFISIAVILYINIRLILPSKSWPKGRGYAQNEPLRQ